MRRLASRCSSPSSHPRASPSCRLPAPAAQIAAAGRREKCECRPKPPARSIFEDQVVQEGLRVQGVCGTWWPLLSCFVPVAASARLLGRHHRHTQAFIPAAQDRSSLRRPARRPSAAASLPTSSPAALEGARRLCALTKRRSRHVWECTGKRCRGPGSAAAADRCMSLAARPARDRAPFPPGGAWYAPPNGARPAEAGQLLTGAAASPPARLLCSERRSAPPSARKTGELPVSQRELPCTRNPVIAGRRAAGSLVRVPSPRCRPLWQSVSPLSPSCGVTAAWWPCIAC